MSLAQSSIIEPAGTADACVIFLHGQGNSGYGFEPLIGALALPASSRVRFVLPGAPIRPLDCRGGEAAAAWYDASVGERLGSTATAQIDAAVAEVQALIGEALEAGIDAGRIIVGGFGQGADIAARAALAYRKGLGGLILLSPELSCPIGERHSANRYMQVALHHGRHDRLMAEASVRRYADQLSQLGYNVDYHAHEMGNQFCAEELYHLRAWLITRLVPTRLVA